MQTQNPRAGRPRMQEPGADVNEQDEETSRRLRMRLAQRRYRSKKQDNLAAAEQKATALETALRGTLSAFRDFQKSMLQHPVGFVPLEVAVAVSKTSLDISSLLHSTGVQVQDTLGCSLLDCSKTTCAGRVLSERLARSVAEFNLHSLDKGELGCFTPELLAGMNVLPGEILLAQSLGQSSPESSLGDIDCVGRFFPQLHRKIEGATDTVLRLAPPKLQRLKYGLTRTWFETDVPELAGEWLEAADVEEYLAQRGIHVKDKSQKVVTLHIGSEGSDGDSEGPTTPEWDPELPDWTIFGKRLDDRQDIPDGLRVLTAAPPVSGGNWLMDQSPTPASPSSAQRKITIDVETLIKGLASRCICLGPAPGIRRHRVDEAIQEAVQIC
ncbi:hypothetical protein LMH87_002117 [Akanthomyces muscarius]|uniref:C-5 cytosine methyltransferase DmtA n=1 Tax=Akanthomyces muscarius TaxID=2231603 RepID=A0A9W8Q7P3_AKAMU|nr:hypothetical protein LMH87_002117 [Akanthomyces muscarius]KAJ4147605.1 hypothetical protein LMH87_002117 [Akanthomyces muscarius]